MLQNSLYFCEERGQESRRECRDENEATGGVGADPIYGNYRGPGKRKQHG